jgi:hypothetical protein
MEITHHGIKRPLTTRYQNGDTNVSSQTRPRKVWVIELGPWVIDIRYVDTVTEKKEEHAELGKMLATESYDEVLLQLVLGSAGTLFECLNCASKELHIPNARNRNHTASSTQPAYTVYKILSACTVYKILSPNDGTWKDQSQAQLGEG